MNHLSRGLFTGVLQVSTFFTNAQGAKPRSLLFERFSDSLSCSPPEIEKNFTLPKGSTIESKLSPSLTIRGSIRASVQKFANLKTVIINCFDLGSAVFSISERTENGSVTNVGRILSGEYDDGFGLQKDSQGNYQLRKFKVENVIMD